MSGDRIWLCRSWTIATCFVWLLHNSALVQVQADVQGEEESVITEKDNRERPSVPIQLVKPAEGHGRFEVNHLALDKLARIDEPVAIVGVTGQYHGGKSLLLNVLVNSTLGFPVGTDPDPETKGLWMRIIPKEQMRGTDEAIVVLLDTEGFYGEGASRSYDAKVFALATLISSHLIYNTLRTLGDLQSVSALADLAKQAQVFNLNNWLKSGLPSPSGGESLVPEDLMEDLSDAALLLKALDFPPLTWVVQGFDIDLDSDHNPLHYLQKYFKAHASTGDRSLDTLFTKGVDCHALRTPADLSFLRERWGDGGLGSHQDLFALLHPGYIAELRNLQQSIFGKLKSKGNLTGRQLASLLPLLVHYVNEDFPLNADRKLREVMVDVILDGAFAGGIQYFQARMGEVVDDRRMPSGGKGKDGHREASLEALVSAAFTGDELEKLMNIAEAYAVAYCEKRCVGVPNERVGPTCKGQLGVKIARMRPEYRSENDRRVKEVLVVLGEALRESAEATLRNMTLPLPESEVERRGRAVLKDRVTEYGAKVGKHRYGQLYDQARSRLESDIKNYCSQVAAENSKKISQLLQKGKTSYMITYNRTIKAEGLANGGEAGLQPNPLLPKQLAKIHTAAMNDAKVAYDAAVRDGGLTWVKPGHEQYDFYHFQSMQWAKLQLEELQALNDQRLKAMCERFVTSLLAEFRHKAAHFSPFPDNHEALATKADALAKSVIGKFAEEVKEFVGVVAPEEARQVLQRFVEAEVERLVKKNTALMGALCYDPLMDAYEELHMQDCEWNYANFWTTGKIWTPKCLLPTPKLFPGFKRKAYLSARRHLDAAQLSFSTSAPSGAASAGEDEAIGSAAIAISPVTRDKVIQAWMENDLARYANHVFMNFSVLMTTILVIFVTMYFTIYSAFGVRTTGGVARRASVSFDQRWPRGPSLVKVEELHVGASSIRNSVPGPHSGATNGMGNVGANGMARQGLNGILTSRKVESKPWYR